ncbi:hypothetical protein NPIL_584941 [Nephila pilipes]|uniref:Uncharacterized protein n=1 Tax=Nephila pilipes TaxID=299642 RepID=A0A8X6P5U9_NEPPI|nr:hypothetical protein NPIL_584941 [Nephila pilipes]
MQSLIRYKYIYTAIPDKTRYFKFDSHNLAVTKTISPRHFNRSLRKTTATRFGKLTPTEPANLRRARIRFQNLQKSFIDSDHAERGRRKTDQSFPKIQRKRRVPGCIHYRHPSPPPLNRR